MTITLKLQDCLDGKHDPELNSAMCKWVGWEHHPSDDDHVYVWRSPEREWFSVAPNYLSPDSPRRLLDEAEASLTDEEYRKYERRLEDTKADEWYADKSGGRMKHAPISSTARQRTIAILKVVKPEMFQ